MGIYHCANCFENHDSDERPPVEITVMVNTPKYTDIACEESIEALREPDPICANCKHRTVYGPRRTGCAEIARTLGLGAFDVDEIETRPDFGCNRFKSKEE